MFFHNLAKQRCSRRLAVCSGDGYDLTFLFLIRKLDLPPDGDALFPKLFHKGRIHGNAGAYYQQLCPLLLLLRQFFQDHFHSLLLHRHPQRFSLFRKIFPHRFFCQFLIFIEQDRTRSLLQQKRRRADAAFPTSYDQCSFSCQFHIAFLFLSSCHLRSPRKPQGTEAL